MDLLKIFLDLGDLPGSGAPVPIFSPDFSMFCSSRLQRTRFLIVLVLTGVSAFVPLADGLADEKPRKTVEEENQEQNPARVRCQVVPLADHQVALTIDGEEKVRWHYGSQYPRPFFYPLNGPAGEPLTRMGHPGAPDHDHHQSIWFANNKVNGLDFWGNTSGTQIRQKQWLCYQDGLDAATMAVLLGWYAADGTEIMEQEVVAALLPIAATAEDETQEHALELQFTLRPTAADGRVELEQTNFGFLAVRVAKSISATFGEGQLTNSEGAVGEKECFAQPAKWMDYSGPLVVGQGAGRTTVKEGITFFDHPQNPRFPTHWHVRQDGWMGAAYGLKKSDQITQAQPLTLRYLLYAHAGLYDPAKAERIFRAFAERTAWSVSKATKANHHFEVKRQPLTPDDKKS